jgi:SAM-dependent methyltransferase
MRDFNRLDFFIQRKRTQQVARYIFSGSTVLDLGCGYFPYSLALLETKIKTGIGIDREISEEYQSQKIRLIKANIEKPLPLPEASFDSVLMLAVLEHLRRPKETLVECLRILKPGGRLIITIPTNYSRPLLETLARLNLISREEVFDHQNYFSLSEAENLLKEVRFKKVISKFYNFFLNALFVYQK